MNKIYKATKESGGILQNLLLPNAEAMLYEGQSLYQNVQKLTKDRLIGRFFEQKKDVGIEQKFQKVVQRNDSQKDILGSIGDIFESSINVFSVNPFNSEDGFPYKNQKTLLQDIIFNEKGNSTPIQINDPLQISYDPMEDGSKEENVCIQKSGNQWKGEFCDTVVDNFLEGQSKIKCKCKNLSPTTVIADIENIFKNSKVGKVFSEDGISALVDFNFWESYIFYIYVVKMAFFLYFIYSGIKYDKRDKILKQFEELNSLEKEIQQNDLNTHNDINEKQLNKFQKNLDKHNNNNNNNQVQPENLQTNDGNMDRQDQDQYQNQDEGVQILQIEDINNNEIGTQKQENLKEETVINSGDRLSKSSIEQKNLKKRQKKRRKSRFTLQQKLKMSSTQPIHTQEQELISEERGLKQSEFAQLDKDNLLNSDSNRERLQAQAEIKEESHIEIPQEEQEEDHNIEIIDIDSLQQKKDLSDDLQLQQSSSNNKTQEVAKSVQNLDFGDISDEESKQNQDENQKSTDITEKERKEKLKLLNQKLDKQQLEKQLKTKKYRPSAEALFRLHILFGIFLVYDEKFSRSKRFVLYYLRIHMLLGVTALFSQNMHQLESLISSLISALLLGIPIAIITTLLKKEGKCPQMIGIFLYGLSYLASVYTILVLAALMGVEKSNEWSISYFSTYCVDTFMFESLGNFVKVSCLRKEIVNGKKSIMHSLFGNQDLVDFISKK